VHRITGDFSMKKLIPVLGLALSFSVYADIDYSRCNQSMIMSGLSVNSDGKIVASPFYDVQNIKTEGKKETYTLKPKSGGGFGTWSSAPMKVVIERDDQGRVVQTVVGESQPNEKWIKEYKSNQAKMMGIFNSGTYEPSVYFDPNAGERADGGSPRFIPVSELSKKDLLIMGIDLSPEDLKKMQKQWKKDKKTQKKLADAYEKVYQSPQFIPMGTTSNFEFVEGACVPSLITSSTYSEKFKTVNPYTIYSKNDCEQVEKVYQKHQKKISECQSYEAKEMSQDWSTIYGTQMGGMGGYGMGVGMGMGFGGYGGYGGGSSMSQLQMKKMNCDMYKNGGGFGIVGGSGSGASSSSSQSKTSNQ
jgi:hypothetical protein